MPVAVVVVPRQLPTAYPTGTTEVAAGRHVVPAAAAESVAREAIRYKVAPVAAAVQALVCTTTCRGTQAAVVQALCVAGGNHEMLSMAMPLTVIQAT